MHAPLSQDMLVAVKAGVWGAMPPQESNEAWGEAQAPQWHTLLNSEATADPSTHIVD